MGIIISTLQVYFRDLLFMDAAWSGCLDGTIAIAPFIPIYLFMVEGFLLPSAVLNDSTLRGVSHYI